jgi:hypothetical protein
LDSLLEDVEDIVNQYNKWLKQNATSGDVKEARELREGKARLGEICRTPITASDLSEEEKRDSTFDHKEWSNQARHFNVALIRLQRFADSLRQRVEQCRKILDEMRKALKALEEVGRGTRSRLLTIQVAEEYKLSKVIRIRLETFLRSFTATNLAVAQQPTDTIAPTLTLSKMLEDLQERHRPLNERYQKAEKAITTLQELVETETNFHNVVQSCSKMHLALAEKADIEPFRTQVRELARTQAQILEEYDGRESKLEESTIDQAIEPTSITRIRQATEQLAERVEEVAEEVRQVWKDYVRECEHFVGSIFELIRLAKKQDALLNTESIEAKCKVLLRVVGGQEWPEKPMSHYDVKKAEIREATMKLLQKSLDKVEGNVLITLISRRDQSEGGWFRLPQIVQEISKEMAMSDAEVEKLLRSLMQKGYLTRGVAIPV